MTTWLKFGAPEFAADFQTVLDSKREVSADVDAIVAGIIEQVREAGDQALIKLTAKFDRFTPENLRFTPEEISAAVARCPADIRAALELAHARIASYHDKQRPTDIDYVDEAGVRLGGRWTAVSSAGLYVPGGTAAYPSSVLMNAAPAKIAGVERLVMVVPTPDGAANDQVLTAAHIAGVDEIYRVGGAQAIAALAYGTETIAPVDKIVGPGNAFVAAAKRRVFGKVGIDMIAGPSEILVLADGQNNPDWIAADLLSQAEHDTAAQSILVTNDNAFAEAVCEAVEAQLKTLPRQAIARPSWEDHGVILLVDDLQAALPLIDRLAPEHMEIALDDGPARDYADQVRNAGSLFIGRYTPEAMGDYLAGPNHVLPTARSARFASGLNTLDFMKRTSILSCDADSLRALGPAAITLAEAEGLSGHARSISRRLNL